MPTATTFDTHYSWPNWQLSKKLKLQTDSVFFFTVFYENQQENEPNKCPVTAT